MYVFILSLAIAMAPGLATLEIPGRLQTPIIAFTMSVVLVLISTLYTVTLIPPPVVRCDGTGLIGKGFPLLWYYAITPYPGIYYCPQITAQPAALPNGSMAFLIDSGFYALILLGIFGAYKARSRLNVVLTTPFRISEATGATSRFGDFEMEQEASALSLQVRGGLMFSYDQPNVSGPLNFRDLRQNHSFN